MLMATKRQTLAAPSPSEADPMFGLGRWFAEAFAHYTVKVLALAKAQGVSPRELAEFDPTLVTAPAAPGSQGPPAWVQEAYKHAVAGRARPIDEKAARIGLAHNKLVLAIRSRGLTQADIAKRLKKSPAAISRILKNPYRSRIKTISEIANAIGVDLSDVLP